MSGTMKALVFDGAEAMSVREMDIPQIVEQTKSWCVPR